jgi:hypothetical protein
VSGHPAGHTANRAPTSKGAPLRPYANRLWSAHPQLCGSDRPFRRRCADGRLLGAGDLQHQGRPGQPGLMLDGQLPPAGVRQPVAGDVRADHPAARMLAQGEDHPGARRRRPHPDAGLVGVAGLGGGRLGHHQPRRLRAGGGGRVDSDRPAAGERPTDPLEAGAAERRPAAEVALEVGVGQQVAWRGPDRLAGRRGGRGAAACPRRGGRRRSRRLGALLVAGEHADHRCHQCQRDRGGQEDQLQPRQAEPPRALGEVAGRAGGHDANTLLGRPRRQTFGGPLRRLAGRQGRRGPGGRRGRARR